MKSRNAVGVFAASAALVGLLGSSVPASAQAPAKESPKASRPIRVAIFPLVNASPELGATKIMDDVLRERLASFPANRASFLYPFDTEQILVSRDEGDRIDRLTERWAKFGTLDSTAVAGLDSLLTVDAILFAKVNEWENHRVPVIDAGSSHTIVGLSFACFDVRSMKRLWSKDPREQRFGQEIDPTSGSVNYDETGFIQNKRATDPPRYEEVASDLVRDAFKKFPEK
ncbi:MAG TPA: hypothetical protein VLT84_04015 [Acidobacteriota bacterium]|nr:hypothetical protein [Acidobacteriota bacterium]